MAKLMSNPQRALAVAYVCFSVALVAVGLQNSQLDKADSIKAAHDQLRVAGDTGASRLRSWRRTNRRNFRLFSEYSASLPAVHAVLAGTSTRAQVVETSTWLEKFMTDSHWKGASLVTMDGRILLAAGVPVHPQEFAVALPQLRDGTQRVTIGGVVWREDLKQTGVTFGAPIRGGSGNASVGALFCFVEADIDDLLSGLDRWSRATNSGEELLLRRSGDRLIVKNQPRFRPSGQLALALPKDGTDLLGVRTLSGETGMIDTVDYRGRKVLAEVQTVPDSPWTLVVKIDEDEVLAKFWERYLEYWTKIILLIALAGAVVYIIWHRREIVAKERSLKAERDRLILLNRYDSLARYANDIILLCDSEGRILDANEKALAAYGYSREELLTLCADDLCAQNGAGSGGMRPAGLDSSQGALFEAIHRRKDGSTFPVEESLRLVEAGGQNYRQSIIRDITERKLAEEALKQSEAQFQNAFQHAAIGMTLTAIDGRFLKVNQSICDLLGYTEQELLGKSFRDITRPEDLDASVKNTQDLLEGKVSSFRQEKGYLHKSGRTIWAALSASLIQDGNARPLFFIAQIQDITERKRIEEERAQLISILEVTPDFAALADPNGNATYINRGGRKMVGIGEDADISYVTIQKSHPEWALKLILEEGLPAAIRDGAWQGETAFLGPGGQEIPTSQVILSHKTPDGRLECLSTIARDITETKRAEKELRESERRYRVVLETANDAIITADQDGLVVSHNRAAELMFGYSGSEMTGMPLKQLIPERYHDRHLAGLERVSKGGRRRLLGKTVELTGLRKDGSEFALELSLSHWEMGGKQFFSAVVRDITDRKRLEQELRSTNLKVQAILESSPAAIVTYSRDGLITSWNKAAESMTGFTAAEVIGRSNPAIPPEQIDASESRRQMALSGCVVEPRDVKRRRKDGSEILVGLSAAPLKDGAGDTVGTVCTFIDLTEQRKAQEGLREHELLLSSVFEQAEFGIALAGLDGKYLVVNPSFTRLTGYTLEDLAGRTYRDIVCPDCLPEMDVLGGKMMRGEVPWISMEKRFVCKDGSLRWVHTTVSLRKDAAGKVTGFISLVDDIQAQKEAEAQREILQSQLIQAQKMESIGRLAGGVAHDFNNYLTVINGYSDLLLAKIPGEDSGRKPVEMIRLAGERATSLTRQLLAFSRSQIVQPRPLNLNDVVAEFQGMAMRLLGEDIEFVVDLEPALDTVWADSGQIQQVLINLAVNARDSLPGVGRIRAATSNERVKSVPLSDFPEAKPGPHVRLSISDNGIGMDAEIRSRIFEPFFTTKPAGIGTGLGLSTVYGIIRQVGGFIQVKSTPGKGSTFEVYIPSHEGGASGGEEVWSAEALPKGTETVLLAEDEPGILHFAAEVLRSRGYKVIEAAGSVEALSLFEHRSAEIQMLVTDVIMPVMGGPELAARLSQVKPDLKILYITGYSGDRLQLASGIKTELQCLAKPFTPAELTTKVRRVLDSPAQPRGVPAGEDVRALSRSHQEAGPGRRLKPPQGDLEGGRRPRETHEASSVEPKTRGTR